MQYFTRRRVSFARAARSIAQIAFPYFASRASVLVLDFARRLDHDAAAPECLCQIL
jgi:hypothetical protein